MVSARNRVRAVVVDIDGTITDSRRRLQTAGVEALRKVSDNGIPVMLASGNVLPVAYGLSTLIGLEGPVIVENGGIVSHREEIHYLNSKENAEKAFQRLEKDLPGVERLFTDRWRETEIGLKKTVDVETVKRLLQDHEVVVEATGFAIHLMEPGHDKINGIRRACDLLDIEVREVAAIGDSDNDVGMVSGCGVGIAVENASPPVKAVADHVCESKHAEGVLEALDWLGIPY